MLIEKMNDVIFDPNLMWQDCLPLIGKYGWGIGQICLTHPPDTTDPMVRIFKGTGTLTACLKEADFTVFNEELKDTYLSEVLNAIPFKLGRVRIMRMTPRTCYSVHKDTTPRIHLPLQTNTQALMLFPDDSFIMHLPADGAMYMVDTTKNHSAMNGGLRNRFHIVAALI